MTSLINFYYENKKKIIISLSLVIIIIIGLLSFYLINYKFKENSKEIVSTEVVKQSKNEEQEETTTIDEVKKIYVDIKGEVISPGVYELDEDSRVIDAINASGGFTANAYTRYLNLSKKLTDEDVIIVNNLSEIEEIKNNKNKEIIKETDNALSIDKEDIITNDYEKPSDKNDLIKSDELNMVVNINTASLEELSKINGIGESTAKKIIDYREKNGNFKAIEDIMNVSGIGEKKYEQIKKYITIE